MESRKHFTLHQTGSTPPCLPRGLAGASRSPVVPAADENRSASSAGCRWACGIDHCLTPGCRVAAGGAASLITLCRASRARDFLPGERRRVAFFHEELGRLVGRAVARPAAPRQDGLPPGLRQALHGPLVGDSETERAARLGVSLATAHQYVTALYRRLGVRSRGQLFAHARRQGKTWVVP